jgi:integrase
MKFVQPIRNEEKIAEIINKLKETNIRNFIMFILGIYTGLRISDILQLKVKDVKDQDYIILIEKKTGKDKRIFINSQLKKELKQYVKNKDPDEYLLKSREGDNKPISRIMAYIILKEVAESCGLKSIGTHTLRKTFGYHTYERTKDVAGLMVIFNHVDQKVTLRYIGKDQDAIDKIYRNTKY